MDGITSWSAFEQQHQTQRPRDGSSNNESLAAAPPASHDEIDTLYVSPSCSEIAPSASALLRRSALAATASTGVSNIDPVREQGEKEFQLRFHWMRPHPHLAFSAMDEAMKKELAASSTVDGDLDMAAVPSSRIVDAYYNSQWNKTKRGSQSDANNHFALDVDPDEEEDTDLVQGAKSDSPNANEQFSNRPSNSPTHNNIMVQKQLPIELPKLRINLANLVEPPLMSSWLPGENIDNSYDSISGDEEN